MRLLTIIYDAGIEEILMERLGTLGLSGYTLLTGAHGAGGQGRKQGDQIWPGTNHLLLMTLAEERAPEVVKAVRELQAEFRLKPGVTILSQAVEEL